MFRYLLWEKDIIEKGEKRKQEKARKEEEERLRVEEEGRLLMQEGREEEEGLLDGDCGNVAQKGLDRARRWVSGTLWCPDGDCASASINSA